MIADIPLQKLSDRPSPAVNASHLQIMFLLWRFWVRPLSCDA